MSKRVFLCLGTESSGTRLWMQHLLACQVWGDATHDQRIDTSFDGAGDLVAWRASFPMGKVFWDVSKMLERLREAGYLDVSCYWTQRDRHCTVQSMLKAGLAATESEAVKDIEEGLRRIGKAICVNNIPTRIVRYERLIAGPGYRLNLLAALGLAPAGELPELRDENAKYLLDAPLMSRLGYS